MKNIEPVFNKPLSDHIYEVTMHTLYLKPGKTIKEYVDMICRKVEKYKTKRFIIGE